MALVYKDGKYWKSDNGVLTEYNKNTAAGDYYSGNLSQGEWNNIQSNNPLENNLASNTWNYNSASGLTGDTSSTVPTTKNTTDAANLAVSGAINQGAIKPGLSLLTPDYANMTNAQLTEGYMNGTIPQSIYNQYYKAQTVNGLAPNTYQVNNGAASSIDPNAQALQDALNLAIQGAGYTETGGDTGGDTGTGAGTTTTTGFDLQSILDLLNNIGNTTAQGTNEDYNTSTSYSELAQALQDQALQGLNGQYGYTTEEQAAIYKNAIDQFNSTQDADLLKLQNLYEQYGLSNPTGMGGQGGSSLQDYYGKRALAQEDLTTNLAQQFSDKATEEKQNAIQNAMGIDSQLYEQQRGDFADMLSLMGFNADLSAEQFSEQLQLMGFESDQQQQQFLNQQGISDREIANYFETLTTENSMNQYYLDYLQGTQVDANTIAQLLGNSESDISQLLTQSANNYQNTESPYTSLATMLGLIANQGNNSTSTADTSSVLTDLLSKLGTSSTGSVDWSKLFNGSVDLSNPLSWPSDLVSGLGSAGASVTLGGKTYTVGSNGLLTDAIAAGNETAANTVGSEYTKTAGTTAAAGAVSLGAIAAATALIGGATAIGITWYKQTKEASADRSAYSQKFDNIDSLISTYKDHNFGNFETEVGGVTKYGLDAVTSITSDTNKLNAWVEEQPVFNQATSSLRQAELESIQNLTGMNAFLNNMDLFYGMFDSQTDYDGISSKDVGLIGLITPEFQTMYNSLKAKYGDSSDMKSYFKETDTKIAKMYSKLTAYQVKTASTGGA